MAKQFTYKEFWNLLVRIANDDGTDYHCAPETIHVIRNILHTDYPYQEDDVEYISDMINYHLRRLQYNGCKRRFPVSKYLDQICAGEFYITEFLISSEPMDH